MKIIKTHLSHGDEIGINNPELIVIHAMAEYIGGDGWEDHAVQFLDKSGLSAHVLIAPDGTIYQCRNDNECAYHAKGYNKNSLGVEFLVQGSHNYASFIERIKTPYLTKQQYDAGVYFVTDWLLLYPDIKITRHSDLSPERKVDPSTGFPYKKFLEDINYNG